MLRVKAIFALTASLFGALVPSAKAVEDPLACWSEGVKVRAVDSDASRHSIHAYFNASPESPDGTRVVYFTSTTREGESGEIRILERSSGRETVVASEVIAEDAHRAACLRALALHGTA